MRQKLHYLCPEEIPGALLTRSGLIFDNPSKCSDCQTTAAGTDLYFGFFQHRGVTRLRRADTQGDKIKHLKYFDPPGETEDCEISPWGDQYRALHVPHRQSGGDEYEYCDSAKAPVDVDVVLEFGPPHGKWRCIVDVVLCCYTPIGG